MGQKIQYLHRKLHKGEVSMSEGEGRGPHLFNCLGVDQHTEDRGHEELIRDFQETFIRVNKVVRNKEEDLQCHPPPACMSRPHWLLSPNHAENLDPAQDAIQQGWLGGPLDRFVELQWRGIRHCKLLLPISDCKRSSDPDIFAA